MYIYIQSESWELNSPESRPRTIQDGNSRSKSLSIFRQVGESPKGEAGWHGFLAPRWCAISNKNTRDFTQKKKMLKGNTSGSFSQRKGVWSTNTGDFTDKDDWHNSRNWAACGSRSEDVCWTSDQWLGREGWDWESNWQWWGVDPTWFGHWTKFMMMDLENGQFLDSSWWITHDV